MSSVSLKKIFGLTPSEMKKVCVLSPLLTKDSLKELGVRKLYHGHPFSSGNAGSFTFIYTSIGAPFVGDAVLYLADTPCQWVILFGSCGTIKKTEQLDIGSLVSPARSYNFESFSHLLSLKDGAFDSISADQDNLDKLKVCADIPLVTTASFGSIFLEDQWHSFLLHKKIDIVEMESSAFFYATRAVNKKALAIFYVTDIVGEQHVFQTPAPHHREAIKKAISQGHELIKGLSVSLVS